MLIKYNVKITNPSTSFFKDTDTQDVEGSFSVSKNKSSIIVQGQLEKDGIITKAYSYSTIGDTYSLVDSNSGLSLETEIDFQKDITHLIACIGKNIAEDSFKEYQSLFKRANRVSGSIFTINSFVQGPSSVFYVKVDSKGDVSAVEGTVEDFSNRIVFNKEIEDTATILYTILKTPLRVDTSEFLSLSKQDVLKLPHGFCKITAREFTGATSEFQARDNYYVLTSNKKDEYSSSFPLLIDGEELSKFTIENGEKILIEISDGFGNLSVENLSGNITLIYRLEEDAEPSPYLCVLATEKTLGALDISYESNIRQRYLELMDADEEFLKKYVVRQYQITLENASSQHILHNTRVLDILFKTDDFSGCTIKNE